MEHPAEGLDDRHEASLLDYWAGYLRIGFAVMTGISVAVFLYFVVLARPADAPAPSAIAATAAVVAAVCFSLSGRIAAQPWRAGFSLVSGLAAGALLTAVCSFDGGVDSPFAFFLVFPVLNAAAALPSRAVAWCGAVTISEIVVLGVSDSNVTSEAGHLVALVAAVLGAVGLATSMTIVRSRLQAAESKHRRQLLLAAETDALTGCRNQGAFDRHLNVEVDRFVRYHTPFSLALCDVDLLKSFNDTFGHAAGDTALAELGATLRSHCRPSDIVARLGGDEFAVILPATRLAEATEAARRLAGEVNRPGARITVSIGVAEVRATEPTSRRVYRDADAMLYEAKSQGRATVAARGQGAGLRIVDEPRATRLADRRLLERRVLQSEQETAEIMARMEALLEAAPIGVSFVDRDLRIEMVNHAIGRLTGAPDEGVVGRTIEEVAPERWPQLLPHYRRVLDLGVSEQFEERSPRLDGDGSESWRLSTIFPVMDRGEVTGVGRVTLDITDRKRLEEATQRLVSTVAAALATAEETRDPYTSGHQARVSDLASAIAGELGLSESDRRDIALAAAVHDVGKIRVPAEILARPGRLREPEMALVREHARTGHDILMTVEFPEPLCRMVLEHHERIDGSGYPDGLRGDAICLGARIIAVADVFDAMSSSRPYRAAIGDAGALAELRTGAGVRYDETVVRAFLRLREDHPGPGVHPPGGPATVTSPS